MLDTLRKNSGSAAVSVIFGAIILVFIFSFGAGSRGLRSGITDRTSDHWAATVNGHLIPGSDFQERYAQRFQMMRRYRGDKYGLEDAKSDNLKEEALKGLIDRELLAQAAERQGLTVTDDELFKKLADEPSFQSNGKFDAELYKNYLENRVGTSAEKFEEGLRRDLLAQKMTQVAINGATVSKDEVRAEWQRDQDAAAISYVRFNGLQFRTEASPTDTDVDAFVKSDHAKIEEQYNKTKFLYSQPHQTKVALISANAPAGGDDAAAKKKIEDAAAQVKSGKDFAAVAKAMSDDPSKDKGGDIGFVAVGRSIYGRAFEEEANKLKVGDLSAPFRDKTGWHVLKALEEKAPETKQVKDVERDIARDLLRDVKAKEIAKQKADATIAELKAGKTLAELWPPHDAPKNGEAPAANFNIESLRKPQVVESSEFHPEGGSIPGIGHAPHVAEMAFSLSMEHPIAEAPVADQDAWFVVVLKSQTVADPAKFDAEAEKKSRERLETRKRGSLYATWIEKLRKDAKVEKNEAVLAYGNGSAGQQAEPEDF